MARGYTLGYASNYGDMRHTSEQRRAHIFISYSRKDLEFAQMLSEKLRQTGIQPWLDVSDIQPGENWQVALQKALQSASVVLYVASQNSRDSTWMEAELQAVRQRDTRITPLILDDQGERDLPEFLRDYQWIDFRQDEEAATQRLIRSLGPEVPASPAPEKPSAAKGYMFVSYAQEDSEFVDTLKEFLANRGYAYWDYRESDRNYHEDLYLELEEVIQKAACTLSILSPEWKKSRTAIQEYHFSVDVETPVFLILARQMGPTLVIAGLPYIDFTHDHADGFRRLDRELTRKGL
jgi:hypothetical protein